MEHPVRKIQEVAHVVGGQPASGAAVAAAPGARRFSAAVAKASCGNSPPDGSEGGKRLETFRAPRTLAECSGCRSRITSNGWVSPMLCGVIVSALVARIRSSGCRSRATAATSGSSSIPTPWRVLVDSRSRCRNRPPALEAQEIPELDVAAPDPRRRFCCAGGSRSAGLRWSERSRLRVWADPVARRGHDAQGAQGGVVGAYLRCLIEGHLGLTWSKAIKLYNS